MRLKISGVFLGVPGLRIILFLGLYWPYFRTLQKWLLEEVLLLHVQDLGIPILGLWVWGVYCNGFWDYKVYFKTASKLEAERALIAGCLGLGFRGLAV